MGWKNVLRRDRNDGELRQELDAYLEEEAAENRARGMSPDEAARQARIKLGNRQLVRETEWRQNSLAWIEDLWRDLRYAVRTLGRAPGFAVLAVLVMALGIGANVALFTVVRSVLLKPLPFRDPDRLMAVYENTSDQFPFNSISGGIYNEWVQQNRGFENLSMYGGASFNLSSEGGGLPEKLIGVAATASFLPTLGVEPALGRNFTADEDRPDANRVVLLSWGLWKRRYGADPRILNQSIRLNGLSYTVIGVMPKWFAYPDSTVQLWTPMHRYFPAPLMSELGAHNFQAVGRLRPGVSPQQALADLSSITGRLHNEHLDNPFVSRAANLKPLLEDVVGDIRQPLYILLAATGCVLLIACLNVANLLVARAAARQKELAIRAALGGSRWRLIRERLTESLVLTACGGAAGMALAFAAVEWLIHTRKDFSRVDSIHIDAQVVLFTLGLVLLCALLTGLIASMGAMGRHWAAALQDATRGSSAGQGRTRLRRALLTGEVALTVVLLVASGLLLKSYAHLRSAELGCTTKNVLTMRINLFGPRYKEPAAQVDFFRTMMDRVRALPGVEGAGMSRAVPGDGYWGDNAFTVVEHPPLRQGVAQFAIDRETDAGFFQTMGIPILRGRSFDAGRSLDSAREAVINQAFQRSYFPNEDPIGKHLRYNDKDWEIVGVVGDTRYALNEAPKPIQYYSLYSGISNSATLVIRANRDPEQYAMSVQRIVASLDPTLPVSDVLTMDQLLGKNTVDSSFNATLLGGFALLSLVLAAAGIFGVLSYVVTQRTSEIGIRMALGAGRGHVLSSVLADGLRPALFGLMLGLAGSVAAVRLLRSMLYETRPLDPSVFLFVSVGLIAVATCACLVPAWRASRLNPVEALRVS